MDGIGRGHTAAPLDPVPTPGARPPRRHLDPAHVLGGQAVRLDHVVEDPEPALLGPHRGERGLTPRGPDPFRKPRSPLPQVGPALWQRRRPLLQYHEAPVALRDGLERQRRPPMILECRAVGENRCGTKPRSSGRLRQHLDDARQVVGLRETADEKDVPLYRDGRGVGVTRPKRAGRSRRRAADGQDGRKCADERVHAERNVHAGAACTSSCL